ncbi:MCE family protein [Nocardia sp. NBC_00565]|uniref:MCE family protein n=1 Tax=Nocardia sp. NBC_00565 TaxID=2975993 RepID=UPI002E80930C|nr:MCE family protein [Nocardia sp. NBC_00565]WUC05632.1 MCE family protein [Nocardia sp. NBC_00565]
MRSWVSIIKLAAIVVIAAVGCSGIRTATADNHEITVTAQFDNGAGLYEGNSVAVLGMPIGKVIDITPKGTFVEVKMRIDSGVEIPANAQAVTVSTSVLTDRHVEFTPVYRGGATLPDNAFLGLDRTKTPIEFDRLLSMADKMSVQLQGDGQGGGPVAQLLNVGAAMTGGNGQDIRAALNQLSAALQLGDDHGAATGNAITTIVNNLSALTSAAAANDRDIREFGTATRQLSDILTEANVGLGDTGAKINEILLQANELLSANQGKLKSTLNNANTVTQALTDYRRELSEFLDLAPLLMDNAYNAFDFDKRGVRIHALLDKIFFDGQLVKEVCNILGMRQLGCSTGTLQDFGPDFGITGMLESMAGLAK